MLAPVFKFLSSTTTESVVASVAVHAAVAGVAGWLVIAEPLKRIRLPGKPITVSIEYESEDIETTEAVTPTMVMPEPPKPVVVSTDWATVGDVRYEHAPTVEPLAELPSDELVATDLDEAETTDLTEELDDTELEEELVEEVDVEDLPVEVVDEVALAQQERLAATRKQESLGHEETPPDLSLPRNTPPVYPAALRRAGVEGTVLLKIHVSASGMITRVEVDRSSGHPALDAAAVNAVRQWHSVPRTRDGVAVDSVERLPVEFRLR